MRQWIAETVEGDLLITLFPDGTLEVAPRIDHTRWGRPIPVHELGSEGD